MEKCPLSLISYMFYASTDTQLDTRTSPKLSRHLTSDSLYVLAYNISKLVDQNNVCFMAARD